MVERDLSVLIVKKNAASFSPSAPYALIPKLQPLFLAEGTQLSKTPKGQHKIQFYLLKAETLLQGTR